MPLYNMFRVGGTDPSIYAARILKKCSIQEYSSDDGEAGGSIHILCEMQYSGITNRLVVRNDFPS